jgi:hypothetical protein
MTLLTPHSVDEHDIREATAELLDYEPGALRKHLFKMHELHSAYARRDLFKRTFGVIFGLRVLPHALPTGFSLASGVPSAQTILTTSHNAPFGELMLSYQLFWLLFIRQPGGEGERVAELAALCTNTSTKKDQFPRWHRIRALPAVAAIHALRSDLSRDEAEALRGVILQTHHVALEPAEDPHREILQIVWANTIAALIRNPQSWQHFQLGPDLINEAEDVCHRFLAGELMLLHAALHAWQFLLTYDRALADRGNAGVRAQVQVAQERLLQIRTPELAWVYALKYVYRHRWHYADMLPQVDEVVMGRPRLNRTAADLFILMRLKIYFENHRFLDGKLMSPFWRDERRAQDLLNGDLTTLANYGVMPSDWPALRSLAERRALPFSKDALSYLTDLFSQGEATFHQSDFEKQDVARRAQ